MIESEKQFEEQLSPDLPYDMRGAAEVIEMVENDRFSNSQELLEKVLTSVISYLDKNVHEKEKAISQAKRLKEKAKNLLAKNMVCAGTNG